MTDYDLMRAADDFDEDAPENDEETTVNENKTDKEKYFEFYDDIKTNIKEDW